MLGSKLSLLLGSCGAVAVGVFGGWTALALMPTHIAMPQTPTPIESASSQPIPASDSATSDEGPAKRPAPALPQASPAEKPDARRKPAATSGPTGIWFDHTGRGAVEITECGASLCGRIVWLKDAGHRSVCGKQIIGNAKRTSAGTWDGGWIYDPDRGGRYSVELKLIGTDKLRVTGYAGSKLFSETYTWKRATEDLARCDAARVSAPSTPATGDPAAAPADSAKAEPSADQPAETGSKARSGNSSIADVEKIARELMSGKSSGKECTSKLPYIGKVTFPCPG